MRVYAAWLANGPGTVREIAARSGISVGTTSAWTDDLQKLGLVAPQDINAESSFEGIYRYVPVPEAEKSEVWRSHANFRTAKEAPSQIPFVTVQTVEAAMAALTPEQQVGIAAAVMARHGHIKKRVTKDNSQMELGAS